MNNLLNEYAEIIDHLSSGDINILSLDHDDLKHYLLDNGFTLVLKAIINEDQSINQDKLVELHNEFRNW